MFLKRPDCDRALDTANQDGDRKIVVIRNPQGREIRSGSGVAYRDELRVWLAEHAPPLTPPEPATTPPPDPVPDPGSDLTAPAAPLVPRFASTTDTGQVVIANLSAHMQTHAVSWDDIADARLLGTNVTLLNDLASKAQSHGAVVSIKYQFDANGFVLEAVDKTAAEWQQCRRAGEQMQRIAGVAANTVDARIGIVNAADAVRTMLHDLDNTHQVTLQVKFQQPDA